MKCTALDSTLSPDDPLAVKRSAMWENGCLSIKRAAGLLDKAYNLLNLRQQNFLINYVAVSIYHHLNKVSITKKCNHSFDYTKTVD